jgi:hypothetical protein
MRNSYSIIEMNCDWLKKPLSFLLTFYTPIRFNYLRLALSCFRSANLFTHQSELSIFTRYQSAFVPLIFLHANQNRFRK